MGGLPHPGCVTGALLVESASVVSLLLCEVVYKVAVALVVEMVVVKSIR